MTCVQNGLLRLNEAVVGGVAESTDGQQSTSAGTDVSSQSSSVTVFDVTSVVNRQLCQDLSNCACEATTS